MYKIIQTSQFSSWFVKLKDLKGKASILRRMARVSKGNLGDYKFVGEDIYELRITSGPAYRVYYTKRDNEIILLLIGGDKSSQSKDIEKAKNLVKEYK